MLNYTEAETLLKVENLSLDYGEKKVLKEVNFEIKNITRNDSPQGQIIAFLGRSGSGKSSLFKILTALIEPQIGKVLIKDTANSAKIEYRPVKEGDIGFVDQKYTLFRHKTVYDAFLFALRNSTVGEDEKTKLIEKYLADWGLDKVRNQYPNELSGGQRQRVAIIEQLLNNNRYLILDEPFSGLDVGNIENVKRAFKLIDSAHEDNCILFSTHDIELAVELSDHIFIIGKTDQSQPATIIKEYDLKKLGLCWQKEITMAHVELTKEIKNVLINS
jgi:ABC-type nitrate/sulfonate/bicarbonate transport system ATPase subunit